MASPVQSTSGVAVPRSGSSASQNIPAGSDPKVTELGDNFIDLNTLRITGAFSDVEIVVGTEAKCFKLHKAILCSNSGYFRTALGSDRFKEGRENKILLPDIHTFAFEHLVYWLYNGSSKAIPTLISSLSALNANPTPHCGSTTVTPQTKENTYWSFQTYTEILMVSIYFIIPSLKTVAVQGCIRLLIPEIFGDTYKPGGTQEKSFIIALKMIFEGFNAEPRTMEPIFQALCKHKYLPLILGNEELKHVLMEEPSLMMKLLSIQSGSG